MTNSKQPAGKDRSSQALGKGFNALLGLNSSEAGEAIDERYPKMKKSEQESQDLENQIRHIKVQAIEPNPHQPRKIFHDDALKSLVKSVKEDGIIQPLVVTKSEKPGKFTLIAGERRWRAARLSGLDTVPVIVKDYVPEDMLRVALIENIQRADLNIIEEAEAYSSLIRDFGLTQEQCADKVGKERSTVTNALRLLTLPRELQDDLMDLKLTMGHGRALLGLEDKKIILRGRDIVIKKQFSVRQTENLVKQYKKNGQFKSDSPEKKSDPNMDYISESLRSHLRTKVKVVGSNSKGKIEISYFNPTELERILAAMGAKI